MFAITNFEARGLSVEQTLSSPGPFANARQQRAWVERVDAAFEAATTKEERCSIIRAIASGTKPAVFIAAISQGHLTLDEVLSSVSEYTRKLIAASFQ